MHHVSLTANTLPGLCVKAKLVLTADLNNFNWTKAKIFYEMELPSSIQYPELNEKILNSGYHPNTLSGYYSFGNITLNPLFNYDSTTLPMSSFTKKENT